MPQIDIQINIRPRKIQVSSEEYDVNIFLEEELAITLPLCYNTYADAECAAREFILEKLRSE